ncbi:unnamed protein product [Linum tenue]|uniref:Uncharacterized protein n=1 Tax=Linum tenue TaxID=586396 RepID=A0AAV0NC90_9ROSI|nr:unnamed protein product [Linum tenue]
MHFKSSTLPFPFHFLPSHIVSASYLPTQISKRASREISIHPLNINLHRDYPVTFVIRQLLPAAPIGEAFTPCPCRTPAHDCQLDRAENHFIRPFEASSEVLEMVEEGLN